MVTNFLESLISDAAHLFYYKRLLYHLLYCIIFFSIELLVVLQGVLERLQEKSDKCNLDIWTANPMNVGEKKI